MPAQARGEPRPNGVPTAEPGSGLESAADLRRALVHADEAPTRALPSVGHGRRPVVEDDHAFATADGAHLVIQYDGQTTAALLAATAHAAPVTDSAGPWPVGQVGFLIDLTGTGKGDIRFEGGSVSGRSDPDTSVDRVTLADGRWWQAPGEIVLAQSRAELYGKVVGDTIDVQEAPIGGGTKGLALPQPVSTGGNQPALVEKR